MKRSEVLTKLASYLEDAYPDRYSHEDGDLTLTTEADLILEFLEETGMQPKGYTLIGKTYFGNSEEKGWENE